MLFTEACLPDDDDDEELLDDDDDESLSELEDDEDEEDEDDDDDEDDDGDRFRRFVVGSAASMALGFCSGSGRRNELRGSSGQTSVLSGRFWP